MAKTKVGDFTQGSVSGNIMRMAWPLIFAQIVSVLYNIIDRMFIGHLPEIGGVALTGLGIVFPYISLINACANWIGQGGSSFFSIERGRGNIERATRILGNSFSLLLIFAAGLMSLGYLAEAPLLKLFGSTPETYSYSAAYMRIYLLGTPFQLISIGLNAFISAQGFAAIGMLSVVIGAILNIILDFILISLWGLGVSGAAIATVLAQLVSAIWIVSFLRSHKSLIRLQWAAMKLHNFIIRQILNMGLANFFFQANDSLVQTVSNHMLLTFGGHVYVGIMTVVMSIMLVFALPLSGLSNAVKPFLSFNYGAGRTDRMIAGINFMLKCTVGSCLATTIVVLSLPRLLLSMFTSNPLYVEQGILPLRLFFILFVFMALQNTGQATFTALGLAKEATFFSLLRKVFVIIPLMIILPYLVGINGVFIAEAISQLTVGSLCYGYMRHRVIKRIRNNIPLRT